MIADALLLADPVLKISECVTDMSRYMLLDDTILNEIERSQCEELEEARKVLMRLRQRDLYK